MLELTTYKNYKELVKALGWEEKKSNNRAGQMKQLDAMCKYHKEGQKFVIEEWEFYLEEEGIPYLG